MQLAAMEMLHATGGHANVACDWRPVAYKL
jgi:hypothetical protein